MSHKPTVLVIDDEPNNLQLLKLDLEDDYEVITAEDGAIGLEALRKNKADVKAVLLDRMMPNMDGMEFMKHLKADDDISNIPVIMQTAAAEKSQVIEGIHSGVYYYLTKPYDPAIMLSIVDAAVSDYARYSKMRNELKLFKSKLHMVKESYFQVQTIEEARYLSTFISNFFPDPERVLFGISEIIINAIEHGNLGISYDEKTELNKQGKWTEDVEKRLALPENKDKRVEVHYLQQNNEIILTIKDEGKGFNWHEYLDLMPERAMDNHGRGIAMAKMKSFDDISYQNKGNEVRCIVKI